MKFVSVNCIYKLILMKLCMYSIYQCLNRICLPASSAMLFLNSGNLHRAMASQCFNIINISSFKFSPSFATLGKISPTLANKNVTINDIQLRYVTNLAQFSFKFFIDKYSLFRTVTF